ncbi:putative ATPase [Paraburkholderia graminis]|nr:putative ATPase [Paraburkholderia graminis]
MKLHLNGPYKSIRTLTPAEIPDLVILTGVNGAGKSHLLQAIESGQVRIEGSLPPAAHPL